MLLKRRTPLRRTRMVRKPAATLGRDLRWEAEVLARDGRCTFPHPSFGVRCWGRLTAHHVIRRNVKATRWDPDNGTALCIAAHDYVHRNPAWSRAVGLIARAGDRVVRGRAVPS